VSDPAWDERVLADPPTADDEDAYKLLSTFAAKGVAVVTARQGHWDHAVTVTDFLSISYDPPTVLVSLHELSRMADAVTAADRFGLCILAQDQGWIADRLGEPGSPLVALLDQVPHIRRDPQGPALLAGKLAWFDVRVQAVHRAATHVLVVGRVQAMGTATAAAGPLVRWRSRYLG
jgi:flavin reductase (DIM6/NTAB) family NADH-FMN oxidoreductase RutF